MKKHNLILVIIFFGLALSSCSKDDDNPEVENQEINLTDADGNIYQTVTIGNQVWMAENLKTTKFNDGNSITEYRHFNPNQSSFPWYDPNNPQELFQWATTFDLNNLYPEELPQDFHGAHYNREAIESGKLEIDGWRLPTQQDFIELINYVSSQGHQGNEAQVLKSTQGWSNSAENGTNLFGFNVKPAGTTIIGGTPDFESAIAQFATSDVNLSDNTRKIATFLDNSEVQINDLDTRFGLNIRLIKE
jgi:uncharacterized protein (TIGR02145 family)